MENVAVLMVIYLKDNGNFTMRMLNLALIGSLAHGGDSYRNINRKSESLNHWITGSVTM